MQLQPLAFANLEKHVEKYAQSFSISKNQLKIGSILHYYGKDAPNTLWEVRFIKYHHKKSGRDHLHDSVYTLDDVIYLHMLKYHETFTLSKMKFNSFRHISKSLLWRLQ